MFDEEMLHGQFLNNYSSGADILIKDYKNKQTNQTITAGQFCDISGLHWMAMLMLED